MNIGIYNMKVENKTIIITDPCYIIKHAYNNPNRPKFENWPGLEGVTSSTKFTEYTPEQLKAYEAYKKALKEFDDKYDDWDKCDYGENMEALGIKNYLTSSTIYGDWSCTTYNEDTKEPIGKFCADAGLVSVFVLEEVRAYNPEIDSWIKSHSWCVTVIENFTGDVKIDIEHLEGIYTKEDEYEYNGKIYQKAGEHWEDDEVRVIGKGSINFFTTQTGL